MMMYLKSLLKGEPLNMVDNMQLSNENFEIALKPLRGRYEMRVNFQLLKLM